MEFGYWTVKRRGEPIRWLIILLGIDVKEWNPATPEEWEERKKQIGPFPNIPFLVDGDITITESAAIPVYLILKSGKTEFLGKSIQDQARVKQLDGIVTDIVEAFFRVLGQGPDFSGALGKTLEAGGAVASKVAQLSTFLADKEYLLGYLTWSDLRVVYAARFCEAYAISLCQADPFAKHQNLQQLIARVESLPGIKERVEATKALPYLPPQLLPFHLKTQAEL